MSEPKKYFYLKVKETFFDSEEMKMLESQKNGILYQNLYLKLSLLSLKSEGALVFKDAIPYDEAMLSSILRVDIDTVRVGLELFKRLCLVEVMDNGTMYMADLQSMIGRSSSEGERVKAYREKIKVTNGQLGIAYEKRTNVQNRTPELELELKKELKKEKYPQDSHSLILATLLMTEHQRSDERYSVTPATLQKWAGDIDKIMRIDGRSFEEVEAVIRWCQTPGGFWVPNVLSGSKLREKFPTLVLQSQQKRVVDKPKEFHDMTPEEKRHAIDKALGRVE